MPEVRLIDANSLKHSRGIAGDEILHEIIDNQPTIEAEPVRRGRWIPVAREPYAKCSYCGEKHFGCATPYCDMCGAYMKDATDTEEYRC